jgi:hypothetical protein
MDGLAMLVQGTLKKDAFSGHLFAFRGKRARIIKILFLGRQRADFRKDNGEAIREVCREFVVLCRRLELFSEASVAIDGSKFEAVNTRDRNFRKPKCSGGWRPRVTTMHGQYRK